MTLAPQTQHKRETETNHRPMATTILFYRVLKVAKQESLLIHAAVREWIHGRVVRDQHKSSLAVVFFNIRPQKMKRGAMLLVCLFEFHLQKHVCAGLAQLHDLVEIGGSHGHGDGPKGVLVVDEIRLLAHLELQDVSTHQSHALSHVLMASCSVFALRELALELALQAVDGQRHEVAARDRVAFGVSVLQEFAVTTQGHKDCRGLCQGSLVHQQRVDVLISFSRLAVLPFHSLILGH